MDITSLLNSSTASAEQQEKGECLNTLPSSRTPWDAGGYSLPAKTHDALFKAVSISPQAEHLSLVIHCDDSKLDSRAPSCGSPAHKSSDSRSSFSSFSSSLQSATHSTTHSRFSSVSTVNSYHQSVNTFTTDSQSPVSKATPRALDLPLVNGKNDTHLSPSLSPTDSLGTLAIVAEYHLSNQRTESVDRSPTISINTHPTNNSGSSTPSTTPSPSKRPLPSKRSNSPSDAVLIKRSAVPALRVNTGEADRDGGYQQQQLKYLSTPLKTQPQPTLVRSHKRCVSAPDISVTMSGLPTREPANIGRRDEPTPPPSNHPDNSSPASLAYPTPDTPPSLATDGEPDAVVCMYIQNCDTGSQPRKAISHIFGRNKMCTRLIPPHVWVHYCRKHYQRSRYRNPKEYAKLQCDLVQQQIRRVHEWSLGNMQTGAAGVVLDWGLSVRKREQKRLEDIDGANRKRRGDVFDHNDGDGEENLEGFSGVRAQPIPATAVPEWLLSLCGKGYSTQAILEIFNRLHTEILDDLMPCFPDIEILPNIAIEQGRGASPKANGAKPTRGHRRSQSLGLAMKSTYNPTSRRLSHSPTGPGDSGSADWPATKKRRPNEQGTEELETFLSPVVPSPSRMAERPINTGRRIHQLTHRPVFANISENQAMEGSYREVSPRDFYAPSPTSYQSPVATLSPHRFKGSSAAHLEHGQNPHSHRQTLHGRSQSDIGALGHPEMPLYPTPSPGYFEDRQGQVFQQSRHDHFGGYAFSPAQHSFSFVQSQQLANPGHVRHRSTPLAQQPASAGPIPYAHFPRPYGNSKSTLAPPPQITETQDTRDLYSARR